MKNHIKNCIKIMGLAAVPFGTAQATDYEIKVTQEHKPDAEHFRISIREVGKEPHVAEIVWPNKKGYPNPILEPNGFMEMYEDEWEVEPHYYKYHYHDDKPRYRHRLKRPTGRNAWINLLKWYGFYGNRLPAANWEYRVRKACEGLELRVVSPGFAKRIKEFIGNDDESERKKKLFCNFEDAVVLDVTNRSFKRFGGGLDKLPSAEKTNKTPFLVGDRDVYGKFNYVRYCYLLGKFVPPAADYSRDPWVPSSFDLFLMRLSKGWLLCVCGLQDRSDFVRVSSDVPTVCYCRCGGVYADNEGMYYRVHARMVAAGCKYPSALVMEKIPTDRYSHFYDKDGKEIAYSLSLSFSEKIKNKELRKIVREEPLRKIDGFSSVVLHCEHGKIAYAWFDEKLSKADMSHINIKTANANDIYFEVARFAKSIADKREERKWFKHDRELAAKRTEDLSGMFN